VRVARYCYGKEVCYGVINKQTVLSLPALAKHFKKEVPQELEDFIVRRDTNLGETEQMLKNADKNVIKKVSKPLSQVSLLPPIPFPPKIICLGLNYFDHATETKSTIPDEPIIFLKPHTAITGPNQIIIKPKFVRELDYEGELCIVVGKTAKNISVRDAKKYIFGYTVFNDVSARDYQFKDGQWTRGKSFDTFAPTGPCITTENQLKNTDNLSIRTWVNGELRQNGSTRNMVFKVSEILHHLSRVMTLEPCDIIATGTPAGVGFAMEPQQFLKHGDIVQIEIEGIGALENTVREIA
jgi:2-keto-4-pentenoate hydratase/2-oxohepta-3-ene-1,7-dioic acid hydratase in catechol pathway